MLVCIDIDLFSGCYLVTSYLRSFNLVFVIVFLVGCGLQ